jgi:hypothetical protein
MFHPSFGLRPAAGSPEGRLPLFAGSDGGARHWAMVASLVATAKLNDVEPLAWLTDGKRRLRGTLRAG